MLKCNSAHMININNNSIIIIELFFHLEIGMNAIKA